jgi:hypothetical protein
MAHRLSSLFVRSGMAAFVAWILISLPIPQIPAHTWFAFVQVPVVIFLLTCYVGKLLIDTFFYNRYKP